MTKTIYLNMRTNYGVETVDEVTLGEIENQTPKEFRRYVNDMVRQYQMVPMNVYKSSRPTKEWKSK